MGWRFCFRNCKIAIYARSIGLAFQVIDHVLDLTQTTESLGKTAGKDIDAEKTTFPKLFGLDRSREVAQELISEAKEQLIDWNIKAKPLYALADFIIDRKN